MTAHALQDSPVGVLTLVTDDGRSVSGLYFAEGRHRPGQERFGTRHDAVLPALREQLAEYWSGRLTEFDVELNPVGTAFQQQVWRALREVPYASTCSYGDLARQIGRPSAVRAVGAANGRNPLCIVLPCHRVIGAGGALTGYAGGIERKRALLDLEHRRATLLG